MAREQSEGTTATKSNALAARLNVELEPCRQILWGISGSFALALSAVSRTSRAMVHEAQVLATTSLLHIVADPKPTRIVVRTPP